MDQLASFYPSIPTRRSIPAWYLPTTFSLTLLPFIVVEHRRLAIALTGPILVALCIGAPSYTFGDPSSDYYNSGVFLAMMLWYSDFVILTPATGEDAPVFRGIPQGQENTGETVEELPLRERIIWAFRLMLPSQRGIGWNWQVRGVPADSHDGLPRWTRVMIQLRRVVVTYVRSAILLVAMGFVTALQKRTVPPSAFAQDALNAAVGWSGGVWVWDRLNCFYSLAAAACIAIGLSDPWEWPPLMGDVRDAWSVRQMWSVVYHQVMRRMVSQPALRIARFLGLRKGSLGSKYTQLFISFGISCLYHQFQMFNVTRRDMGEFAFFMSQPVAIAIEDFVQWAWRVFDEQSRSHASSRFARNVGYVWVFTWFSFSLPLYIKGLRDADIVRDALLANAPFAYGESLALDLVF